MGNTNKLQNLLRSKGVTNVTFTFNRGSSKTVSEIKKEATELISSFFNGNKRFYSPVGEMTHINN